MEWQHQFVLGLGYWLRTETMLWLRFWGGLGCCCLGFQAQILVYFEVYYVFQPGETIPKHNDLKLASIPQTFRPVTVDAVAELGWPKSSQFGACSLGFAGCQIQIPAT